MFGTLLDKLRCATFLGRFVGQIGMCNILGSLCWTNWSVQHFGDALSDKLRYKKSVLNDLDIEFYVISMMKNSSA